MLSWRSPTPCSACCRWHSCGLRSVPSGLVLNLADLGWRPQSVTCAPILILTKELLKV